MRTLTPRDIVRATCLALPAVALTACGGSGSDSGGAIGLQTLSGKVTSTASAVVYGGGAGVEGAVVSFEGRQTITDANGNFILPQIGLVPTGTRVLQVDGSTAVGGALPSFEIGVSIEAGNMDAAIEQPIVIPDPNDLDTDLASVLVDGFGRLQNSLTLETSDHRIQLTIPQGSELTFDGDFVENFDEFVLAALDADEVPEPTPASVQAASFVIVGPSNTTVAAPEGEEVVLVMPNDFNFALGEEVDMWHLDPVTKIWTNLSAQSQMTAMIETVNAVESVVARGIVNRGGIFAPVRPVEVDCSTTLAGTVVDAQDQGIAGLLIVTSLGATTTTSENGEYVIEDLPAYTGTGAGCTPAGFTIDVLSPPFADPVATQIDVLAGDVAAGGITILQPIPATVDNTGCLAGVITGLTAGADADVELSGPTTTTVDVSGDGSFFTCDLDAGEYTASYLFSGAKEPVVVDFTIEPKLVRTIAIQNGLGGGASTIDVTVLAYTDGIGTATEPLEGASVTLAGSDEASAQGLVMLTDANGRARFTGVSGPYDVTAFRDIVIASPFGAYVRRELTTVLDLTGNGGQISVLMGLDGSGYNQFDAGGELPNVVAGTISSVPTGSTVEAYGKARASNVGFQNASDFDVADPAGAYSLELPAGFTLDVFFTQREELVTEGGPNPPQGIGHALGLEPLEAEETRTLDFDLAGTSFAAFDNAVPFTIAGLSDGKTSVFYDADFDMRSTTARVDYGTELDSGSVTNEFSGDINLPSASDQALAGFDVRFSFRATEQNFTEGTDGPSQSFEAKLSAIDATGFETSLIDAPAWTQLTPFASFAALNGVTLDFTPSSDTRPGFENIRMDGYAHPNFGGPVEGGEGGREFTWSVFARQGTDSFSFPEFAESLFGVEDQGGGIAGFIDMNAASLRFDGTIWNFDAVFGGSGSSVLDAYNTNFTVLHQAEALGYIDFGFKGPQ